VTRDDIRRLMGAYATGSLTDTERKALFEAALDDQDLFDELAREQAMKEVIAEPGVRERLIAGLPAVESEPVAAAGGWRKPLAWGLSAAFVLSMSIAAVVITRSTDTRQASQKVATLDGTLQPVAPAPGTTAPEPIPQSASAPHPTPARVTGAPAPSSERPPLPENQRASAKKIGASGFASGRLEPAKPAQNRGENRDEKRPAKDVEELDKAVSTQPAAAPIPAPPPPITNLPLEARRGQPPPLPTSSFAPGNAPNPTSNSTTGSTISKDQGQKDQGQGTQASDSSKPKQASDQVAVTASTGQVEQLRVQNAQIGQTNSGQINTGQINNGSADNSRSKAAPQFGVAAGRGGAEAKTSSVAAPRAATPVAGGGGGSARGLVGGTVGGLGTVRRPAHFAFDYTIDGEDLTLKFTADGYVSIHFVPGGVTIVGARVTAGSTRREHIPANATEVNLLFTAAPQPGAPGVSLTKEPKDVRSGTVEDPAGARIDLLLRLY
jgi:hypothetical protein